MIADDLPALRADFPGWQIEFYTNSAGDYLSAFLPSRVVKAPDAKRLRERLAHGHTASAVAAVFDAVAAEPDFAGWLAAVLTSVAARLGSSAALVAGRPGSWESGHVLMLAGLAGGGGRPRG